MPHYPLLLGDLAKTSDKKGTAEFVMLESALDLIKEINSYLNERKREVESRSKVKEIEREYGIKGLYDGNRIWVRDIASCDVKISKNSVTASKLCILSDMLVAVPKDDADSKKKKKKVTTIELTANTKLELLPERQDPKKRFFAVVNKSSTKKCYALRFVSKNLRGRMQEQVQTLIDILKKKKSGNNDSEGKNDDNDTNNNNKEQKDNNASTQKDESNKPKNVKLIVCKK
eukprot:gb/GECH01006817.1/.p1 GENE.gb/GECH01006817.1/~~gb/GECH01006817.1/.p1  ORF type:complete len:230 (+),score=61.33 gb/GECH01006817.1/:1-690(+)